MKTGKCHICLKIILENPIKYDIIIHVPLVKRLHKHIWQVNFHKNLFYVNIFMICQTQGEFLYNKGSGGKMPGRPCEKYIMQCELLLYD